MTLVLSLLLVFVQGRSLALINASGSPYDVGRAVGSATAANLPQLLNETDLYTVLLPFCTANASLCDGLFNASRSAFPAAYAQLSGVSDGTGIPLRTLLAWNCADEIHSLRGGFPHDPARHRSACTALLDRRRRGVAVLGHNEDGGHCIAPPRGAFMLAVANRTGGAPSYVSMTYPALLPGYAFSGVVASATPFGFSVNSEFIVAGQVDVSGSCNAFATHAILDATSAADAVRRLSALRTATGFTANVVGLDAHGAVSAMNVEVGPGTRDASAQVVRSGDALYAHFNQYVRLNGSSGVREYLDESSQVRAHRVSALCDPPAGQADCAVLDVLSDEGSSPFNIWRSYVHPEVDHCMTLASARFTFSASTTRGVLDVFTERPRGSAASTPQWSWAL